MKTNEPNESPKTTKTNRRFYAKLSPRGFDAEYWIYSFGSKKERDQFVGDEHCGRWEFSEHFAAMVCRTSESARCYATRRARLTRREIEECIAN